MEVEVEVVVVVVVVAVVAAAAVVVVVVEVVVGEQDLHNMSCCSLVHRRQGMGMDKVLVEKLLVLEEEVEGAHSKHCYNWVHMIPDKGMDMLQEEKVSEQVGSSEKVGYSTS